MARIRPMQPDIDLVGDFKIISFIDTLEQFIRDVYTEGHDYSEQSSANHRLIKKIAKDLLLFRQLSDEEQQDIFVIMRARISNTVLNVFSSVMTDNSIMRLL